MSDENGSKEPARLPSSVPGEGASRESQSKLKWLKAHERLIWRILLIVVAIGVYFHSIDRGLNSLEQRVAVIERQVSGIDDQVSAVDKQVGIIEIRISTIENSVARIEGSVNSLDGKLDNILLELARRSINARSSPELRDEEVSAD